MKTGHTDAVRGNEHMYSTTWKYPHNITHDQKHVLENNHFNTTNRKHVTENICTGAHMYEGTHMSHHILNGAAHRGTAADISNGRDTYTGPMGTDHKNAPGEGEYTARSRSRPHPSTVTHAYPRQIITETENRAERDGRGRKSGAADMYFYNLSVMHTKPPHHHHITHIVVITISYEYVTGNFETYKKLCGGKTGELENRFIYIFASM